MRRAQSAIFLFISFLFPSTRCAHHACSNLMYSCFHSNIHALRVFLVCISWIRVAVAVTEYYCSQNNQIDSKPLSASLGVKVGTENPEIASLLCKAGTGNHSTNHSTNRTSPAPPSPSGLTDPVSLICFFVAHLFLRGASVPSWRVREIDMDMGLKPGRVTASIADFIHNR